MRSRYFFVALFMCLQSVISQTETPASTKELLVDELFRMTNAQQEVEKISESMIDGLQPKYSDVPKSYWRKLKQSINYSSFFSEAKKIYLDNFTQPELEALLLSYDPNNILEFKDRMKHIQHLLYKQGNEFNQKLRYAVLYKVVNYKGESNSSGS